MREQIKVYFRMVQFKYSYSFTAFPIFPLVLEDQYGCSLKNRLVQEANTKANHASTPRIQSTP